jgi:hypothetical protein
MSAVPAVRDQWFTIDRDGTIVDCGEGVPGVLAQSRGMTVWDAFPGSREKFQPIYDLGWREGHTSATVYYNGAFSMLECVRRDDHLLVSFQFIPIQGLLDAIEEAVQARREAQGHADQPAQDERRLRLVRSG